MYLALAPVSKKLSTGFLKMGLNQGCQIFIGPSIPDWEKYNK
jgi:hypothetical protein